jgi:hypothetical protein
MVEKQEQMDSNWSPERRPSRWHQPRRPASLHSNESSFDPLMHLGVPTSVTSRIHNLKEKGEKEEGVMILEC